ncbi:MULTISPECIES: DUF1659 domain-containing protein [Acinetobacter]
MILQSGLNQNGTKIIKFKTFNHIGSGFKGMFELIKYNI